MSKGTARDFIGKIIWEGGPHGAADYGLKAENYDLPTDVIAAWQEFTRAAQVADRLAMKFEQVARDAGLELE